jgi:hypothetical protein
MLLQPFALVPASVAQMPASAAPAPFALRSAVLLKLEADTSYAATTSFTGLLPLQSVASLVLSVLLRPGADIGTVVGAGLYSLGLTQLRTQRPSFFFPAAVGSQL